MTLLIGMTANVVAPHRLLEDFRTAAAPEIAAAPPWRSGVCFLPECGAEFVPSRDWQLYCCRTCAERAKREMRSWGYRMAFPLLLHRMGKYETDNVAVQDLTRAARRYVSQSQSAWLADRRDRAEGRQA